MASTTETTAAGSGPATRRPLALLVVGQVLSGTGSWAALIAAQGYATFGLHGGPVLLALVAMAWGAPPALLAPLTGKAIDTWGPRRVGIVASLAGGAFALGLAAVPGAGLLVALLLGQGVARAFATPAVDVMPTWLASRPDHAVSSVWLGFATNVPVVAGPLLASFVLSVSGPAAAFVIDALTYGVGAAVLASLAVRAPGVGSGGEPAGRSGLRPVWRIPGVAAILTLTLVLWASYGAFGALEVLYVRDTLDAPVGLFALLQGVFGVGLVATSILITGAPRMLESRWATWGTGVGIGVGEVVYVCSDQATVAFCGVFVWGVAAALFGPASRVYLLTRTPETQHGSAMSAWRSLQASGSLVPTLGIGFVAAAAGTQATLVGVGVTLTAVTSAAALRSGGANENRCGSLRE